LTRAGANPAAKLFVSRAAIVLGIDRRSLHRMLVRFGRTTRARAGDAVAADCDERDDSMA